MGKDLPHFKNKYIFCGSNLMIHTEEGEGELQTDRDRDRETGTDRYRETDRDRHIDRKTARQPDSD